MAAYQEERYFTGPTGVQYATTKPGNQFQIFNADRKAAGLPVGQFNFEDMDDEMKEKIEAVLRSRPENTVIEEPTVGKWSSAGENMQTIAKEMADLKGAQCLRTEADRKIRRMRTTEPGESRTPASFACGVGNLAFRDRATLYNESVKVKSAVIQMQRHHRSQADLESERVSQSYAGGALRECVDRLTEFFLEPVVKQSTFNDYNFLVSECGAMYARLEVEEDFFPDRTEQNRLWVGLHNLLSCMEMYWVYCTEIDLLEEATHAEWSPFIGGMTVAPGADLMNATAEMPVKAEPKPFNPDQEVRRVVFKKFIEQEFPGNGYDDSMIEREEDDQFYLEENDKWEVGDMEGTFYVLTMEEAVKQAKESFEEYYESEVEYSIRNSLEDHDHSYVRNFITIDTEALWADESDHSMIEQWLCSYDDSFAEVLYEGVYYCIFRRD